ncbi:hypothetical protein AB0I53_01655 [Saccharopolyspora sp. NPDC050389]|uniref:hypothetical protein n=1 Tax=Saccharopolyspora sp. NPDC050389 TaxID=3155516 RepID=UPI003406D17E
MNAKVAPRRRKWPFIVIPVVALLLVVGGLLGLRAYYVLAVKPHQTSAEPTREAVPTTSEPTATRKTEPPKPGAPVPCDPELPNFLQCFPEDYNPDAAMDGVAAEGWSCLRQGERTEVGSPVSTPRLCETKDNVGQPYTIRASIKYQRHLNNPNGKLREFILSVSTSAAVHKGEHTTMQDPAKALIPVFVIAAKHIWQGRPEELGEATEAFEQLQPLCASPASMTTEGVTTTMPSGYKVTCTNVPGVGTGDARTYGQFLQIRPA